MLDTPDAALAARLAPLAAAHKGRVALAVIHLNTGQAFRLNADIPMPTASLIKLQILVEAYQQIHEGKLRIGDMVTLYNADKVAGSGILTEHFSESATFPLRDILRLMIRYSDNTATNLVLDRVGIRQVNERMTAWGWPNSRVYAKVYRASTSAIDREGVKKFGLGSTTADETLALLRKLHAGQLVSPQACQEMLAHLKTCDDEEMFKRRLPDKVTVYHKTGAVSAARTSAGILDFPGGPVAVCVLTCDNEDKRWVIDNAAHVLCAEVAREVYEYFRTKS